MEKHKFLHAKNRIGQGEKVNYGSNRTVFRREDLDDRVVARKDEVVTFAKGEKFSNHKSWNKSTHLNNPLCERKKMENFVNDRSNPYQYNYRAESLGPALNPPEDKPHKFRITMKNTTTLEKKQGDLYDPQCKTLKRNQEMPVHAKLQEPFSREWNCSTEFVRKDIDKKGEQLTKNAKVNSEKMKTTVDKEKFKSPQQLSANLSREVRKQKEAGTFSVHKPVFQVPEEQVDRTGLVNRYAVEPDLSFVTTKHSGVWEKQPDGRYMWSDTGSYIYDSPGDIVIKHNPDHYNYAKPNLSRPAKR